MALSHTYKFGSDGRLGLKFEINALNVFNENNVTSVFQLISPDSLTGTTFGFTNAATAETDTIRAIFAGGLTDQIVAGFNRPAGDPRRVARDVRYGLPRTFQTPRQVRFGFKFIF
jgi:hypothetical protein